MGWHGGRWLHPNWEARELLRGRLGFLWQHYRLTKENQLVFKIFPTRFCLLKFPHQATAPTREPCFQFWGIHHMYSITITPREDCHVLRMSHWKACEQCLMGVWGGQNWLQKRTGLSYYFLWHDLFLPIPFKSVHVSACVYVYIHIQACITYIFLFMCKHKQNGILELSCKNDLYRIIYQKL